MNPNEQADKKSENRREQLPHVAVRAANVIVGKRGQIHAHEGDKRAKIQQLSAIIVCDEESADEGDCADKEHVICGNVSLRMNRSKEFSRDGIASAHAIEKPRGSKL